MSATDLARRDVANVSLAMWVVQTFAVMETSNSREGARVAMTGGPAFARDVRNMLSAPLTDHVTAAAQATAAMQQRAQEARLT